MDPAKGSRLTAILLATLLVISATLVNGQISTPCTVSMISSFTPCFNFVTGSIGNGSSSSSPTTGCCGSLQTIMSTSVDCACLLITANVPVQLPINRTLALSLPRACNMAGVPALCKASGSPLPSPGSFGPALAPTAIAASPFSPRASKAVAAPAPESETTPQLTPASPPVEAEAPATNPGMKPAVLNPSASAASYVYPAPLLLLVVGVAIFKSY